MGGIILFIMPFIFRLSYDDFVLLLKTESNTINRVFFFFFKGKCQSKQKTRVWGGEMNLEV